MAKSLTEHPDAAITAAYGQGQCAHDCPGKATEARIARLEGALEDSTLLLQSARDENDEGGIAAQVEGNRAALEGRDE